MLELILLSVLIGGIFMCGWYAGKIHMILQEMNARDIQRERERK
jgi:hypothetical protein